MRIDQIKASKTINQATLLILLIGAFLRIVVYFQNRSFFIDEANLARNIVEKGLLDFFAPLDYEQYAPPLFLVANKVMIWVFGVHEYSLTFISLLAGIGTLILMYLIAKHLKIHVLAIMYISLLLSFSELAIRYSTELKQYALDAFLILAFIYWVLKKEEKDFTLSYAIKLAIIGSLAIWSSMPIVFLLASIGLYYLLLYFKNKSIKFSYLCLIGASWIISFSIYFYTILKIDVSSDYLNDFHQRYFFNFFPSDLESAKQSSALILGLFRLMTDKTMISLIGTGLLFIYGCKLIIVQKKRAAFLMLMTLFFCLLASQLELYSMLSRLTLFMIPLMLIIFAFGLSDLWKQARLSHKILLVAFMLLTAVNKNGYHYFWNKMEMEDGKLAMEYFENHRLSNELIYVYHSLVPSFAFYNDLYTDAKGFDNYYMATWEDIPIRVLSEQKGLQSGDVFWLYLRHTEGTNEKVKRYENSLIKKAVKLEEYKGSQFLLLKYQYQ